MIFIEFPLIFIDFLWFWEAREAGGGWRRLEAAWRSLGEPGGGWRLGGAWGSPGEPRGAWGLENIGFSLVFIGFLKFLGGRKKKTKKKLKLSGRRGWAPDQPGASLGAWEPGSWAAGEPGGTAEAGRCGGWGRAWGSLGSLGELRRLEEAGGEVCV